MEEFNFHITPECLQNDISTEHLDDALKDAQHFMDYLAVADEDDLAFIYYGGYGIICTRNAHTNYERRYGMSWSLDTRDWKANRWSYAYHISTSLTRLGSRQNCTGSSVYAVVAEFCTGMALQECPSNYFVGAAYLGDTVQRHTSVEVT